MKWKWSWLKPKPPEIFLYVMVVFVVAWEHALLTRLEVAVAELARVRGIAIGP